MIAKQLNLQKKVTIPSLTFLIHNLALFTFQGVQLMIITFENRKVKLFEVETGHFQCEFQFLDSSLDTFTAPENNDSSKEQDREANSQLDGEGRSPAIKGGEAEDILTEAPMFNRAHRKR